MLMTRNSGRNFPATGRGTYLAPFDKRAANHVTDNLVS